MREQKKTRPNRCSGGAGGRRDVEWYPFLCFLLIISQPLPKHKRGVKDFARLLKQTAIRGRFPALGASEA